MAGIRSAGLLSLALLAAVSHAAPFQTIKRDDDACPFIPMSDDDSLTPPWNSSIAARSMWRRDTELSWLENPSSAIEKRASGEDLWDSLNSALDDEKDDAPCFQFDPAKWHDYKSPRSSLPYTALRPIFKELGLPVGEFPDHQSFEDRNFGKNAEDKVYKNLDLRFYEDGYDPDDDETPVTGHFLQQMSVANGVIVAVENDRAVYKDEDGNVKFKVPANWKDATWFQWQRAAAMEDSDVSNLKYIFRYNVDNGITKDALVEAFDGDSIFTTKTFSYDDDKETFLKLLGTPNGSGIPKFLISNLNGLGKKTIESISIRAVPEATGAMYMMWFTLTEYDD